MEEAGCVGLESSLGLDKMLILARTSWNQKGSDLSGKLELSSLRSQLEYWNNVFPGLTPYFPYFGDESFQLTAQELISRGICIGVFFNPLLSSLGKSCQPSKKATKILNDTRYNTVIQNENQDLMFSC
jgi:hypothetical protein